jgi:hypothetical protein
MRLNDPFGTPVPDNDEQEQRYKTQLVQWETTADKDNAQDASNYLGMFKKQKNADRIIDDLKNTNLVNFKAKDILRAAGLQPQPKDDAHVQVALQLIANGTPLTPVYLLRGKLKHGIPVTIADGYHRISAAFWTDPSTDVSAYIARP